MFWVFSQKQTFWGYLAIVNGVQRNQTRVVYVGSYFTYSSGHESTDSGVPRTFPGGQLAHPEDQNEEENEENLRKNGRKWGKIEEIFLSCPPGSERLTTVLVTDTGEHTSIYQGECSFMETRGKGFIYVMHHPLSILPWTQDC